MTRFPLLPGYRLLAVLLLGAQACISVQPTRIDRVSGAATTIVVVRHAEKSTDDPRDPSLSEVGQARARKLSAVLKDAGVTDIYTTHLRRTRQTAEPLAQRLGLSIVERPISSANSATYARDLATDVLKRSARKSVLIVGHSNTVPDIVAALSGIAQPAMTEAEYDHIFVIVVPANGVPRLISVRFP